MIKRCFDLFFSLLGLLLLSPFFAIIAIIIKLDSKGPVLFTQTRVGEHNTDFKIYKFRTMYKYSESKGKLTLGNNDSRITKVGYFLRLYKLDEFPQLINILKGDMSFVGPRPELRHYVNFYNNEDLIIFNVKPGITGLASLQYKNEVELLKASKNPEDFYINTIIPDKLKHNKTYINKHNFFFDIKIIISTITKLAIK